jgi:hypothetical protein
MDTIDSWDIADATKKTYKTYHNSILRESGAKNILQAIKSKDKLVKAVEASDTADNTKRLWLSFPHTWITKTDTKLPKTTIDFWKNIRDHKKEKAAKDMTQERKSDYIPQKELRAKRDALPQGMDKLLLAMYTMIPPRRLEYSSLKISKGEPKDTDKGNHLVIYDNGTMEMILNKFKTFKTMGQYRADLPEELVDVISADLVRLPRENLFINIQKKPFATNDGYGKWLSTRLDKLFGKGTLNTLRHSYVDWVFEQPRLTTKDKNDIARAMGQTSLETQDRYRTIPAEEEEDTPGPSTTPAPVRPPRKKKPVQDEEPFAVLELGGTVDSLPLYKDPMGNEFIRIEGVEFYLVEKGQFEKPPPVPPPRTKSRKTKKD